MIDIKTIKLVVWDLDDTFWTGTLSEDGATPIDQNMQLVRDLTDCGIINSICSKNELDETRQHLKDLNIWDEFVFASINWDAKGPRLKQMVDRMALRPVNVLFLDDNSSNLGEAQHFLPQLQVAGPEIIPDLITQVAQLPKKDTEHKRLKQYKVLEQKAEEAKSYGSNEDFLYSSQIRVVMHNDCMNEIERLHDLLMRSNQLNFTKKRISIDELQGILTNPSYTCGYVSVTDRFGDYGIVGFYAIRAGVAEHFLFSCRTMGQMIEQWVYAQLGFPKLEVVGEVRTQLNETDCPKWINQIESSLSPHRTIESKTLKPQAIKVLLKGPCDLSHAEMYIHIAKQFDAEYTYVSNDGRTIDAYNHSVHILGSRTYTNTDKRLILDECDFLDTKALESQFFTGDYDVIFLSTIIEATRGIYHRKGTDVVVAYYTDTKIGFGSYADLWEYEGLTTPDNYIHFLEQCLACLPQKTTLCLILGPTCIYEGNEHNKAFYANLNDAIVNFAQTHTRIRYVKIDDCIHDKSDFTDALTHFASRVYYEIAQQMICIIQDVCHMHIQQNNLWIRWKNTILTFIRYGVVRVLPSQSKLYIQLSKIYKRWTHKR